MSTLAKTHSRRLAALWEDFRDRGWPEYRLLRAPEIGLVMLRGRIGGQGDRFNLGEMTVTRCAVRLQEGQTGISYLGGRHKRAAEIAAVLDAMMQNDHWRSQATRMIVSLDVEHARRRETTSRRREATRVNFFTMTRSREQK